MNELLSEIQARNDQYARALVSGDGDGFVEVFEEDGGIIDARWGNTLGRTGLRQLVALVSTRDNWTFNIAVQWVKPDGAYVLWAYGRWHASEFSERSGPGGNGPSSGSFVQHWRRHIDDRWYLSRDVTIHDDK